MQQDFWSRLAAELERFLELDLSERASQLETLFREDPELARMLDVALRASDTHIPLLDDTLQLELEDSADAESVRPPELQSGVMIGPWKLIRRLGRGGMGQVWLAVRDDEHDRIEVAVKLIDFVRQGDLLSRQIRTERQILADLDHPQIARLVDGGVRDDGTPWYAMEYVHGLPLDEYCRRCELSLNGRLRLIAMIARTLHHAHTRLVVHRDLKPSNILVDADGMPHLLDFGIAKLLQPDAETRPGAMTLLAASTPAYAAPEQLRGDSVGTAADIYSLGVIAYEIITGSRPPRADSEVVAADSSRGPLPSRAISGDRRLRSRVRDDIDSIVSQAMAPEISSRYASAEALAEDIDRHLTGQPVLARRAGAAYRGRKFVRRHWFGVSLGSAAVLALCLALVYSTVQTYRAEAALARASTVQDFLIGVFDAARPAPDDIGIVTQRDLAERAVQQLEAELTDHPDGARVELLMALGRIFRKLGFVERSREVLQQALETIERGEAVDSGFALHELLYELGRTEYYTGDFDTAINHLARADRLTADMPGETARRAAILYELGSSQSARRQVDTALGTLEDAIDLAEEAPAARELLPRIRIMRAITLGRANRLDEALRAGEQAIDSARRILGEDHERTASALSAVGGMNRRSGNLETAERMLREAHRIELDAYGQAQSATVNNLANVLKDQGHLREAGRLYRQALELAVARLGADAAATASYQRNLALYQAVAGDADKAADNLDQAYAQYASAHPPETGTNLNMRSQLSWVLLEAGRAEEARELLPDIFSHAQGRSGVARLAVCRARMVAARLAMQEGEAKRAAEHIEAALTETDAYPVDNAELVRLHLLAGDVYAAAEDLERAISNLRKAQSLARNRLGANHPLKKEVAARRIITTYGDLGFRGDQRFKLNTIVTPVLGHPETLQESSI